MAPVLLWFKRELRVFDNAALARAVALGPVLPLYVAEPDYWRLPDTSARQWGNIAETLADLRADLGRLGQPLVIRSGDAVAVIAALCARHGITRIVSHEETGNLWTFARDRRLAAWARGAGVVWEELPQSGVVRRLASRDGWSSARDAFMARPPLPAPRALAPLAGIEPGPIPGPAALSLAPDACPGRQEGGRRAGLALLEGFLATRGQDYRRAMSSPLSAATSCSRLSVHFASGALSLREAVHALEARRGAPGGTRDGWAGALASFAARLAWRDHFIQKLEDAPAIGTDCLHPACEALRPRLPDSARLDAWQRGETGLPFVDACMRALAATGWINFRIRAMLVSVASYHLWLDWRATGPHLARLFTDYEPGIHWPQMQMQSGTTGMNTARIYNPVKQGEDQDPQGAFTRRWVPELAEVPDRHLQAPWRWEGAGRLLGRAYPEPVVAPEDAARAARAAILALRRAPGFREAAAPILRRHASRKGAGMRARGARGAGTRPQAAEGQLSLDL